MTTETILTDDQIEHGRHNTFSTNNPFCPCDSKTMRKAARWAEQAVLQAPEVQTLRNQDPLQGAANWLVEAIDNCRPTDIMWRLSIGHNRAQRLHAAAMEQQT